MSADVRALQPNSLWNCFADLNAVPRPSKREERVVAFMLDFAQKNGLQAGVDKGGNVVIKKPATADRIGRPAVILQAHLDMVHKAAKGHDFDFANQGIEMFVDGDWVRAKDTTLGADNGLGAAAIMAVLKSTDLSHPPIEALFTVDEEQGMSGALALEPGVLTGRTMLNLDSEEDHAFTIGCAGGIDTLVTYEYTEMACPSTDVYRMEISGLRGGHSGLQIHEGRANAIKLMARILAACGESVAISTMTGGSARNAIPAQCTADVAVLDEEAFQQSWKQTVDAISDEFRLIEPKLSITAQRLPYGDREFVACMSAQPQRQMLLAITAVINGVFRMSPVVEGMVEASSNLSLIELGNGQAEWSGLQRSSVESTKHEVAAAFAAPFRLLTGTHVRHDAEYPGWSPSAESPILEKMKSIYQRLFGHAVEVGACHAGLECGVIAIAYPGLDMISFGPNIREAHSEKECASISSAQKFWKLLTATLAEL